jgi:hypothetical protein
MIVGKEYCLLFKHYTLDYKAAYTHERRSFTEAARSKQTSKIGSIRGGIQVVSWTGLDTMGWRSRDRTGWKALQHQRSRYQKA